MQNLVLNFIERDKANMHYSVVFLLNEIVSVQPDKAILKGSLSICGKSYEEGYVEYKTTVSENSIHFHRIKYYKGGSLRRINPLIPDPLYSRDFELLDRLLNL